MWMRRVCLRYFRPELKKFCIRCPDVDVKMRAGSGTWKAATRAQILVQHLSTGPLPTAGVTQRRLACSTASGRSGFAMHVKTIGLPSGGSKVLREKRERFLAFGVFLAPP